MIGRAGIDRPWIFREIAQLLRGETPDPAPTPLEQRDLLLSHYDLVVERFGTELGVKLMRKIACHYSKGLPGARAFRDRIGRVKTGDEFLKVIAEGSKVITDIKVLGQDDDEDAERSPLQMGPPGRDKKKKK